MVPETFRAGRITTLGSWGMYFVRRRSRYGRLNQCLRFRGRFLEDFRGHFLDANAEFKARRWIATTPAIDLPVGAHKRYLFAILEVQEQRMLAAIELLRETDKRLRVPGRAVGGSLDQDIERFLFDDIHDIKSEQKDPMGGPADVRGGTVPFSIDHCFLRDQKSVNHGERIVTQSRPRLDCCPESSAGVAHGVDKLPQNLAHFLGPFPGRIMSRLGHHLHLAAWNMPLDQLGVSDTGEH